MTSLKEDVEKILGVPIIDPVLTGYKMLKSMLDMHLVNSKTGLFREPYPKKILNEELLK